MNTLDELRRTLDAHADHADHTVDQAAPGRVGAVHQRVKVVRRRRRAAAAGAVAAVVAVVGGVALLPESQRDAGPGPASSVVGVDVPRTLTSLGFTYRAVETVAGEGDTAVVRLEPSDEPRLVSWATSGDDDTVRVRNDVGTGIFESTAPDFTNFTTVPAGAEYAVRVRAEAGTPGIAVFELTDDRPAGVTGEGTTFRQETATQTLAGAVIGEPGQAELVLDVVPDAEHVSVHLDCKGGPDRLRMELYRDDEGEPWTFGRADCGETLPVDPASLGSQGFGVTPGDPLRLTARFIDPATDELVESDDLVAALGVYAGPREFAADAAQLTEYDGHVWRLVDDVVERDVNGLTVPAPTGLGEVLAVTRTTTGADNRVETVYEGRSEGYVSSGRGIASLGALIASAGGDVSMRVSGEGNAPLMGIAFYERVS